MRTVLVVTFEDEVGKHRRIIINNPVNDLDRNKVETFARVIIEAGVFSTKGRYKKLLLAEKIVTETNTLVSYE